MVLAKGKSSLRTNQLSLHTQTQIALIKLFLPDIKMTVTEKPNDVLIEIEGLGISNDDE